MRRKKLMTFQQAFLRVPVGRKLSIVSLTISLFWTRSTIDTCKFAALSTVETIIQIEFPLSEGFLWALYRTEQFNRLDFCLFFLLYIVRSDAWNHQIFSKNFTCWLGASTNVVNYNHISTGIDSSHLQICSIVNCNEKGRIWNWVHYIKRSWCSNISSVATRE